MCVFLYPGGLKKYKETDGLMVNIPLALLNFVLLCSGIIFFIGKYNGYSCVYTHY